MSLRDRLAAKPRRRETIPVQVSDPSEDRARVATARAALVTAQFRQAAPEELERLQAEADAAEAAERSHFELVEFEALDPDEFDELLLQFEIDDGVDVARFRPVLAARCAVDPELRDEGFWAEQFASGRWSKGERDDLYYRLFTVLNCSVPSGAFSKG